MSKMNESGSLAELLATGINAFMNTQEIPSNMDNFFANSQVNRGRFWKPNVDIIDVKTEYKVLCDLPGIDSNSIDIDVYNNILTITGERKKTYSGSVIKTELVYGKFKKDVVLPIVVTNKDNVSVNYIDGVLIVSIDKKKDETNRFSVKLENKKI